MFSQNKIFVFFLFDVNDKNFENFLRKNYFRKYDDKIKNFKKKMSNIEIDVKTIILTIEKIRSNENDELRLKKINQLLNDLYFEK